MGLHPHADFVGEVGWQDSAFLLVGPWGLAWLRSKSLWGLTGLDNLTHSLFWRLLLNISAYVAVSLWRAPSGREASQALLFVDAMERGAAQTPVFWRGRADVGELRALCERFLGSEKTQVLWAAYAVQSGAPAGNAPLPDARLVQFVEAQLAGAVGSASARVLVAAVSDEETISQRDVFTMLDEASQLRSYSRLLERATGELRSANEQLKSLDRLKDDFMSSMTHELRTPLTSIRALAETLQAEPALAQAQRQQFIGIIVQETERLTRLVNQVLDMARIEAGHVDWQVAAIDLPALLEQAAAAARPMLQASGARLEVQVPSHLPLLHADPDRLQQVLLNLLSNAAKFVPSEGGVVQLQACADAQGVTVCVQDNGSGAPAGHEQRVFERFHQAGGPVAGGQGTGLGLPISRHIVEYFGGRIWLETVAECGARFCFCFWLPWQSARIEDDTA